MVGNEPSGPLKGLESPFDRSFRLAGSCTGKSLVLPAIGKADADESVYCRRRTMGAIEVIPMRMMLQICCWDRRVKIGTIGHERYYRITHFRVIGIQVIGGQLCHSLRSWYMLL